MRNAQDVMQSITFEHTDDAEHPASVPASWPAGTRPIAVAWDDDDVQVMVEPGVWCRQAVGLPETACGTKIDYRLSLGLRASSYLGTLCRKGCFSWHELDQIAPRLTELHEREQQSHIDKIVDGAHQNVIDGENRRRKKKDK